MLTFIPVTSLDAPELAVYARCSETQLFHFYEPGPGLFIAESPLVIERALSAGYEPVSALLEETLLSKIPDALKQGNFSIPAYTADRETLSALTGFALTRGMLCAMKRKALPLPESLLANARRIAILEDVVNPTNIGAIFRSAAALQVDAVLLTSGCSDPLYRRAIRVSMGTVFQIPWTVLHPQRERWPDQGLLLLQKHGFQTAALALRADALPIGDERLKNLKKLALILGTEGDGLSASTIAACDHTVRIPMSHGVDSLNVAAASAVAFYELCAR